MASESFAQSSLGRQRPRAEHSTGARLLPLHVHSSTLAHRGQHSPSPSWSSGVATWQQRPRADGYPIRSGYSVLFSHFRGSHTTVSTSMFGEMAVSFLSELGCQSHRHCTLKAGRSFGGLCVTNVEQAQPAVWCCNTQAHPVTKNSAASIRNRGNWTRERERTSFHQPKILPPESRR